MIRAHFSHGDLRYPSHQYKVECVRRQHTVVGLCASASLPLLCDAGSHLLIARPHLNTLLHQALQRKLTLLSAPASFGKTTLLAASLSLTLFRGCRGRSLPAGVWGVPRISLFSSLAAAGGANGREKSAVTTQTSVPTTTLVPIVPKRVRERGELPPPGCCPLIRVEPVSMASHLPHLRMPRPPGGLLGADIR